MTKTIRAVLGSCAAIALGIGGALAGATVASASDIVTPGWSWTDVNDDGVYIDEAESFYENYLGSGIDVYGFTTDAFDGFLDEVTASYGLATVPVTFTAVSSDINDNGLSTIVGQGLADFGGGNSFTITSTLEIKGSYARWTFTFDAGASAIDLTSARVDLNGDIGADEHSKYTEVNSNALVISDTYNGSQFSNGYSDPIMALYVESADEFGGTLTNGDDVTNIYVRPTGPAVITVGLIDWDPCSWDSAYATMLALAPTLPSHFGETIAPARLTNCLLIQPAVTPLGAPVDVKLPLTQSEKLALWNYISPGILISLVAIPIDLPAGLTLTLEEDADLMPYLHLVGTAPSVPTTVTVLFTLTDENPDLVHLLPMVSTLEIGPGLAATGVDASPVLLGAAIAGLLGVSLVLAARRVRRSRR